EAKTIEIRKVNGKEQFIVDGEEVGEEEMEEAYLHNLEEREKRMIKMGEAKMIQVQEKGGEKIIIVDGKEVSRQELGAEGKAEKIFVKMLDADDDPDVEVEIKEIRVTEDGEERIIEIAPKGDEKARYKTFVIDTDKAGDFPVIGSSKAMFYRAGEAPLIFIDGKKASKKKLDKLDPDQIESINVLKGDTAVEQYGKKAADGVIEITTRKQ
ncbi:MAG: TonB-dependent receptor plug domain-containing protein, partial [Eudoraea sp.]|nr:TonB-dependent receptor plug domain-containing protein [Eudoraea sp.]